MKKIAHFITTAGLYGAERWVLTFLQHVKDVEVHLICTTSDHPGLIHEAETIGITCHVIETRHNLSLIQGISNLGDVLIEQNIDLLHTHGYKSDILGYFAARIVGIKIISTPHGWDLNSGVKVRFYDWLDRQVLRFFDRVVPLSEPLKKSLSHISSERIELINNMVDTTKLPEPESRDPYLLSFIGRLTPLKRVKDIILALHQSDNKIHLQIIGEGPEKQSLVELCDNLSLTDRVAFLGYRDDRLELLNKSGIFLLSSVSEGTSRSMMEAMALGLVVIGSDIEGNNILIDPGESGYLFPLGNSTELAKLISYVTSNPDISARIGSRARLKIEQNFSADSIAQKYMHAYKQLLNPRFCSARQVKRLELNRRGGSR